METLSSEKGISEARTAIREFDRHEYNLLWFVEHVLGENALKLLFPGKKEDLKKRIFKDLSRRPKGNVYQIEETDPMSPSEFRRTYLKKGIPVIMRGAAKDWECVKKWNPEFLADCYGDDPVSLIDASPDNMQDVDYQPEETTLRDVILSMDEEPIKKYSRFNRILYDHPELLKDFDEKWLLQMRNPISSGKTFQVFIGGKGSNTHLHCASEHNLFTQVYGRKHWVIYPAEYDCVLEPPVTRTPYFHSHFDPFNPDYEKFPSMEYLDRFECILEPGDILFNPPSYWHHVTNLTGSIGVGFRWFAADDSLKIDYMQAILTLLAVNPPIWFATLNRTNFPKIFSYMNNKK